MILGNQNFYSNFSAGQKSGDTDLTKDILVNEISDFITTDTLTYVDALSKVGIRVSENDTDETIVDKTVDGLKDNDKLPKALAYIIADTHGMVPDDINTPEAKQQVTNRINKISEGIEEIAKKIGQTDSYKTLKEDILAQIEVKAEEMGNYKRTIYNKKWRKRIIVLGGLVLLGVIIYHGRKMYLAKKGGSMTAAPLPNPTPVPQQPIQPVQPQMQQGGMATAQPIPPAQQLPQEPIIPEY